MRGVQHFFISPLAAFVPPCSFRNPVRYWRWNLFKSWQKLVDDNLLCPHPSTELRNFNPKHCSKTLYRRRGKLVTPVLTEWKRAIKIFCAKSVGFFLGIRAKSCCENEAEDSLLHVTSWNPHWNILKIQNKILPEFSEPVLVNKLALLL